MSITSDYTATHYTFVSLAAEHRIQPFALRLVLALGEDDDGRIDVHRLADLLKCDGSAIRRACQDLYALGWVWGDGADGGARRPGVLTVLGLTDDGRAVAERVREFRAREAARG